MKYAILHLLTRICSVTSKPFAYAAKGQKGSGLVQQQAAPNYKKNSDGSKPATVL